MDEQEEIQESNEVQQKKETKFAKLKNNFILNVFFLFLIILFFSTSA